MVLEVKDGGDDARSEKRRGGSNVDAANTLHFQGAPKTEYADYVLEDVLNVVAQLPEIAATIYRNVYFDGVVSKDTSLDYSGNFCRMLGYNDPGFDELMRLYLCIHTDHEGGNASAHATHLVGSTLSDPYLAYAGGLNALAGPLHGLANQEVRDCEE